MSSRVNILRLVIALSFTAMALASADAHPFAKGNKSRQAAKHSKNRTAGLVVNNDALNNGSGQREVIVDINKQRAYLLVDGVVAVNAPVSTARSDKYTPRGSFRITQRVRSGKISTIYGCDLPFWMRLDSSAIGLHVGELPGYPASAGCVRLTEKGARLLFENTNSGVAVRIVDNWQAAGLMVANN
jgi:lipoprotein-anchoring transpeptidase ErfK/SrfK